MRTWGSGALLSLGDELKKHKYFDRGPILEMIYHLRNGVAHGNRFNIDDKGRKRLSNYPAHNRTAATKSPLGTIFEITANTSGCVLFDYLGPADLIDIFQSVEIHLLG